VDQSRAILPRPACGERVGVRGRRSLPLTRNPALCAASVLSPQAGRGDSRYSIQRNGALTGDRERLKKRNGTKTIGRGQGHRSIRRAGADAHLTRCRCRADRRSRENRLHLALGAGGIAARIIDHHIPSGLLDGEQHRVPLPKRCPKLDNAEDQQKQQGEYQRRLDHRRSLVPAALWVFPARHNGRHDDYCVRTTVVAVSGDGKTKSAQGTIGLKGCCAVTEA